MNDAIQTAWVHRVGGPPKKVIVAKPKPRVGEVLVRPLLVGICGTDRGIASGNYQAGGDVVLGHEAVGVVSDIGPMVDENLRGARVVVNPTLWCGHCRYCTRGSTNVCERKSSMEVGISMPGLMQESAILPAHAVLPVPPALPTESAVLIEPLACVMHGLAKLRTRNLPATVLGGGPIGALAALLLHEQGRHVTLVEPAARRAAALHDHLGMDVQPVVTGERTSLVVDAVGNQLQAALSSLEPDGQVLVLGCRSDYSLTIRPLDLIAQQATLFFSSDYDLPDFSTALESAARLDLQRLLTHKLTLNDVDEAYRLLDEQEAGRDGRPAFKVAVEIGEAEEGVELLQLRPSRG